MAAKYDHINFRPPTSVANAAKRGLKMRSKQSKSNQGGTAVGLARANQLAKRETLSPSTVKRMKAFFDRHQKNKKVDSGKKAGADKGQQAWLLWGGDAGRSWSAKKVKQIEKADEKKPVKRALNSCGMTEGGTFDKGNSCAGTKGKGKKTRKQLLAAFQAGDITASELADGLLPPEERKSYKKPAKKTHSPEPKTTPSQGQNVFFKDSKVRDKDGDLLTVYHGTMQKFDAFENPYGGWNMFSDNYDYSRVFAKGRGDVLEVNLNIKNPLDLRSLPRMRGDARNELLRLLKYKAEIDELDWHYLKESLPYEKDLFAIINQSRDVLIGALIDAGYDGIIMPDIVVGQLGETNEYGEILGDTYIAFVANQIKLTSNKNPTSNKQINRALNSCGMTDGGTFAKGNSCAGTKGTGKKSQAAGKKKATPLSPLQKKSQRWEKKYKSHWEDLQKIADESPEIQKVKKEFTEALAEKIKYKKVKDKASDDFAKINKKFSEKYKYDIYSTSSWDRIKKSLEERKSPHYHLTEEEAAELLSTLEADRLSWSQARGRKDIAGNQYNEVHGNASRAETNLETYFQVAVASHMQELELFWFDDNLGKDTWQEYNSLARRKELVADYAKGMTMLDLDEGNYKDRALMDAETLTPLEVNSAFNYAMRKKIEERSEAIKNRMKVLAAEMDDGTQLNFPFDDGDRGDFLERQMRKLWHEERIENSEAVLAELEANAGDLSLGNMGDNIPDRKERAAKALQIFHHREQLDRYKKQFEKFKEDKLKSGVRNQYFEPAEDTEIEFYKSSYSDSPEDVPVKEDASRAIKYYQSQGIDIQSPEDFAKLGGLADDTNAEVYVNDMGEDAFEINIELRDGYKADRTVVKDDFGRMGIYNNELKVYETGQGLGTEVLARQVQAARAAGFEFLTCTAARSDEYNGYITWAKLGYDGDIPYRYQEAIEEHFGYSIDTISELVQTVGGLEYWQEHGGDWEARFDLDPRSYSSKRLEEYMERKGMYEQ